MSTTEPDFAGISVQYEYIDVHLSGFELVTFRYVGSLLD